MDRLAARVATFAFVALSCAPGSSQQLARLHVRSFDMSADRTALRVGEPFHLTITARLGDLAVELDNVTLPDLTGFESLGDERRCAPTPSGSECSETLTLSPTIVGDRTISPTTMDAVDARNGKPSRFATNSLKIHVAGPSPLVTFAAALGPVAACLIGLLRAVAILALLGIATVALFWGFSRRRRRTLPTVEAPVAPSATSVVRAEPSVRTSDLIAALVREPTRVRALAVRGALRAELHAQENETLADLAARSEPQRARTLTALAALESAAFCEDERVPALVEEALPFLKS